MRVYLFEEYGGQASHIDFDQYSDKKGWSFAQVDVLETYVYHLAKKVAVSVGENSDLFRWVDVSNNVERTEQWIRWTERYFDCTWELADSATNAYRFFGKHTVRAAYVDVETADEIMALMGYGYYGCRKLSVNNIEQWVLVRREEE